MPVTYKQVSITKEMVDTMNCDKCNADIPQVFTPSTYPQGDGKLDLEIRLTGGYGEFIDGKAKFFLCKDCSTQLCKEWPVFKEAIDKAEFHV